MPTPRGTRRASIALLGLAGLFPVTAALAQAGRAPAGAEPPPLRDWRAVAALARAATITILADRDLPLADALQTARPPGARRGRVAAGTVLRADGLVLTAAHAVHDAQSLIAVLADGRTCPVRLLGIDLMTDLALLDLDPPEPLTPVRLDRATPPEPGEPVLAVGSPFGLAGSVSSGIVSGLDRPYNAADPMDYLQHDAAINPGSSGGPLLDAQGRLLGINAAVPERERGDVGVGLAIPAPLALAVAVELERYGRVSRGWLGLGVQSVEPALAAALGLGATPGLVVSSLSPGGPATRGLQPGDLLLSLDDRPLRQVRDLAAGMMRSRPGQPMRLTLLRAGTRRAEVLHAVAAPHDQRPLARASLPDPPARPQPHGLGFGLASFTRGGAAEGVLIRDVADGAGREIGLRPGDMLLRVGHEVVTSPEAAEAAIGRAGPAVAMLLRRAGDDPRWVVLPLRENSGQQQGNTGGAQGGVF